MSPSVLAPGRPLRVVVVDDDDINRRGMSWLLAECEAVDMVAALTHTEGMEWGPRWETADLVLVDATDERAQGDQFPGVAVVQDVRRWRGPHETTVVAVTGHFFHDALRRRLREARADYLYDRSELAERRGLYDAVLRPDSCWRIPGPEDPEAELRHGVTGASRVNRAVAYALDHGLMEALEGRSSRTRAWMRLRREFNREARLTPMTLDGHRPDRRQDVPSVPQIERFLAWATRVRAPVVPWRAPAVARSMGEHRR